MRSFHLLRKKAEAFYRLDDTTIENSILKRHFAKLYHQQKAQLNEADEKIENIFGESKKFYQQGNRHFQLD